MKFILYITTFLLIASCSVDNNQDAKAEVVNPLKGLSEGKLSQVSTENTISINDSSVIYSPDGAVVPNEVVLEQLISGDYIAVPYVNENNEYSATVIRKATAEEKKNFEANKKEGTSSKWLAKELPLVSVQDIQGKRWTIEELKGKVTVLNFWFINCKPCLMEIPELNKIVAEYQSNDDIVFLAFAEDQKNDLEQFLTVKEFDYNIIPASDQLSKQLGVEAFPTHMVLNKDGVVAYTFTGYGAKTVDAIRKEINYLLKA